MTFHCRGDEMEVNDPKTIWCTEHGNYSGAPPTCHKTSEFIFECLLYSLENIPIKFLFVFT